MSIQLNPFSSTLKLFSVMYIYSPKNAKYVNSMQICPEEEFDLYPFPVRSITRTKLSTIFHASLLASYHGWSMTFPCESIAPFTWHTACHLLDKLLCAVVRMDYRHTNCHDSSYLRQRVHIIETSMQSYCYEINP